MGAASGARSGPPCSWPGISGSLLHRQLPLQEDPKAPGSSLPLRTIPLSLPAGAFPSPCCRQDRRGPHGGPGASLSDRHTFPSLVSSQQPFQLGRNSSLTTLWVAMRKPRLRKVEGGAQVLDEKWQRQHVNPGGLGLPIRPGLGQTEAPGGHE